MDEEPAGAPAEPPHERGTEPAVGERLRAAWSDPDRLYREITAALDRGVSGEVVPAARRLREIDPIPARGANTLSFVLRTCADHHGAERVLFEHLNSGHDDAVTWFNLAPLAAWRGASDEVDEALDAALSRDPDYADALEWGYRHHARIEGRSHARAWLTGHAWSGWRAHIIAGREALRDSLVEEALEAFDAAHQRNYQRPEPLSAIAALLWRGGRPRELIDFVLPRWRGSHGPYPLLYVTEANLHTGLPGDAALALSRLRGIPVPAECSAWVTDVERRVQRACTRAGI